MNILNLTKSSVLKLDDDVRFDDLFHHHFSHEIIRKYDIRGIVNETLFDQDAYALGLSFAQYLIRHGGKTVAVAYDGRHSSIHLHNALVTGLVGGGLFVSQIGLGPTPLLYYSVHHLSIDAGIMVTGSHNGPDYNGFKITLKNRPFFGKDLEQLSLDASRGLHKKRGGKSKKIDISSSYVGRLYRTFQGFKELKVVWDPGNGAAGQVIEDLVSVLPGVHRVINAKIDGDFPNHHPDPTIAKNLQQMKNMVLSEGYDLGIAFDGDGDRIGAVDNLGRIIPADKLMTLFSKDILSRHPKATFIADVKTSQTYFDTIENLGGTPLLWHTGHSLIKTKMIETNAIFGGEMSGHIFFADSYYGFDDALYAAVRLLSLLALSPKPFDGLVDQLPVSFATPEIRIPCPENNKRWIMENIRKIAELSTLEINTLDGVRVSTNDGWWLVRPSNTEPVLVARCEATTKGALTDLLHDLDSLIKSQGLHLDQNFFM